MQRLQTLNTFAVAALFTILTLAAGCGGKRVETKAKTQVSIDADAQLSVPRIRQLGIRSNCGPTSAAMVLAAYQGVEDKLDLHALRNKLGRWSYENHAMRRLRLPGVSSGMTPESILIETLNKHSDTVVFGSLDPDISYLRSELSSAEQANRALEKLNNAISDHRPVLALVQSKILWPDSSESLHWVVVTGVSGGRVTINDPADGNADEFSIQQFVQGWRLNPFFRTLPMIHSFVAIVGDQSLPAPVQAEPLELVASGATDEITALASVSN